MRALVSRLANAMRDSHVASGLSPRADVSRRPIPLPGTVIGW